MAKSILHLPLICLVLLTSIIKEPVDQETIRTHQHSSCLLVLSYQYHPVSMDSWFFKVEGR